MAGQRRARVVQIEDPAPAEEKPAVGVAAALRTFAGAPLRLELAIKSAEDARKSLFRAVSLIDEIGEPGGDVPYADELEVLPVPDPESVYVSFDLAPNPKLASGIFNGSFPGALREAADLVAGVYAPDGPLEKCRSHLNLAVDCYAQAKMAYPEGELGSVLSGIHADGVRMTEQANTMFTAAADASVAAERVLLEWLHGEHKPTTTKRNYYIWQAIESMNLGLVIIGGLKRNIPRQDKVIRDAAVPSELKLATDCSEEARRSLVQARKLVEEASDLEVVPSGVLDVAGAMPAPFPGEISIRSAFDLVSEVSAFAPKPGHIQQARQHLKSMLAVYGDEAQLDALDAQAVHKAARNAEEQLSQALHHCILAAHGHKSSLLDVLNTGHMLSFRPLECVTKAVQEVVAALGMLRDLSDMVMRNAP